MSEVSEYELVIKKGQRFFMKINNNEMYAYEVVFGELKLDFIRNTQIKSKRLCVKPLAWSLIDTQIKKETNFGYYKAVDCQNEHQKFIIPNNVEYEIGPLNDKSIYIKVL